MAREPHTPSTYVSAHQRVRDAMRPALEQDAVALPNAATYVLTYFLPLPEVLAVPDAFSVVRFGGDLPPGLDGLSPSDYWPSLGPTPPKSNFMQLNFRQIRVPFTAATPGLAASELAAGISRTRDGDNEADDDAHLDWTVAEATTLIPDQSRSAGWDPHVAFDHLLAFVRDAQVNCLLATGHPTTLLELPLLPPIVLARSRFPGDKNDVTRAHAFVTGTGLMGHLRPDQPSETQLAKLSATMHQYYEPHLLTDARVLIGDAQLALDYRGDARAALLNCDTASQVVLDSLLLAALWEEGSSASDATAIFNSGLVSRIKSQYTGRFGGNWQLRGPGPLARWQRCVAHPRHRAVHLAEQVSPEIAREAIASGHDLVAFVSERLRALRIRSRFPKTALLVGRFDEQLVSEIREKVGNQATHEMYQEFDAWRAQIYVGLPLFQIS